MAQEKNLENRIKQFLKDEGCYFIKYWGGGGFTKAGVPDLLICCNGHFIAAELKAENGKPSELQIVALTKIQKAGGIGVLVFPEDEITFRQLIMELRYSNMRQAYILQKKLEEKVEVWKEKYQII